MLYEVLGDIWVVQRNPYLEDDLLANRERRDALIEALRHRLREIDKRRQGNETGVRPVRRGPRPWMPSSAFRRDGEPAPACAENAVAPHAARQHLPSTAWPASRTSPTPPTGASSIRSSCSTPIPRKKSRALVRDCIELGLTIIPRGGGTGYTGGAVPLTPSRS
jgi:hypothetical protein